MEPSVLYQVRMRMPFASYSKWSPTNLRGRIIIWLQSGHKVLVLYCFSSETWNVRCTLISGVNSNLYTSLNTRSTMENGPAKFDINFGMRPLSKVELSTFNNTFWPTSYPFHVLWHWLGFGIVFGLTPTTWYFPKPIQVFWPNPHHIGWLLVLNVLP